MKETLSIPEEYLSEVIKVIRTGLKHTNVSGDVKYNLKKWCNEEEEYLNELKEEERSEKNTKKTKKASKV